MKNQHAILKRVPNLEMTRIVPYLSPDEVHILAQEARKSRNGERDYLFILFLYQTGVRISEALSLTPSKICQFDSKPVIEVIGKGKKLRIVSCPESLARRLKAYGHKKNINLNERFFPFNRIRGWQIIKEAAFKAGFEKRVFPHLLRHSDAIERLRQTGNPKALQHHLGHSSISMVMRYLSTLTQEESLRIVKRRDTLRMNRHIPLRVRFCEKSTFLDGRNRIFFQRLKILAKRIAKKIVKRRVILCTRAKDIDGIKMSSWIRERLRTLFFGEKEKTLFFRSKTGILIDVEAGKGIPKRASMWHPLLLKEDYHKKRRYGCHSQSFRLTMLILS